MGSRSRTVAQSVSGLPRRAWLLFFLAVAVALLIAGGKKVQNLIFQDEKDSVEISPAAKPIRQSSTPLTVLRAAPGTALYIKQYANDQQNSRLHSVIPPGAFRVRWRSAVHETLKPNFVLHDGNRIVVQAAEWRLFDMDGKLIGADRLALGYILMDAPNDLMYVTNPAGYLAARKLADGVQLFNFLPRFGNSYARIFITRKDQRMIIAGVERPRGAHGDFEPTKSLIETFDLGSPPRVDSMGFLDSLLPKSSMTIPSIQLIVAGVNEKLVAAIPNRVYFMDSRLKVETALDAEFEPVTLSLDEAGRVYLAVKTGERTQLWVLSPTGEQFYSFALPPATSVTQPPVVGYDHTVYLVTGQTLIAVGTDGKIRWSKAGKGRIVGASVTSDDQLLTGEGAEVALYNSKGERRLVCSIPEGEILTPPILTSTGEILVASAQAVYSFARQ
jgi:hypothetical protein